MDTILLTGFEPFGGERVNPSWEVAQALHGERLAKGQAQVEALKLPCEFSGSRAALDEALNRLQPRLVLALGQAAGRSDLSLERVAVNLCDARIADNAGDQPIDEPVEPGGPAAYFTTLPVKAMVAALRAAGLPAGLSMSAGSYVCNYIFYALQHRLAAHPGVRSGFMHLPLLPAQAAQHPGQPSMTLQTMIEGTRIALETALAVREDLRTLGGSLH